MRIGIYSPYLDSAGGGERYMMTIAEALSNSAAVDVFLDAHLLSIGETNLKEKIEKLHGLNLSKVNFINAPFGRNSFFLKRMIFLKKYDFIFYLSDGSIFYSTAKKNILHLQSPIKNKNTGFWGKLKQSSWDLIIYNSKFTEGEAKKSWKIMNKVIYPPVAIDLIKPAVKKKQIISVGRFASDGSKKQDVLIKAFANLKEKDWSFHLVGAAMPGDKNFIEGLKKSMGNLRVNIHENLDIDKLISLYAESSIYWHATGFGEKDPNKMEHFGIATVEAMAAGCVPVVINLGGQREIVNSESGFLWNSTKELVEYTNDIINDQKAFQGFSKEAIKRSKIFSKEKFVNDIKKIVYG